MPNVYCHRVVAALESFERKTLLPSMNEVDPTPIGTLLQDRLYMLDHEAMERPYIRRSQIP
jgi:hypothetical protein